MHTSNSPQLNPPASDTLKETLIGSSLSPYWHKSYFKRVWCAVRWPTYLPHDWNLNWIQTLKNTELFQPTNQPTKPCWNRLMFKEYVKQLEVKLQKIWSNIKHPEVWKPQRAPHWIKSEIEFFLDGEMFQVVSSFELSDSCTCFLASSGEFPRAQG